MVSGEDCGPRVDSGTSKISAAMLSTFLNTILFDNAATGVVMQPDPFWTGEYRFGQIQSPQRSAIRLFHFRELMRFVKLTDWSVFLGGVKPSLQIAEASSFARPGYESQHGGFNGPSNYPATEQKRIYLADVIVLPSDHDTNNAVVPEAITHTDGIDLPLWTGT